LKLVCNLAREIVCDIKAPPPSSVPIPKFVSIIPKFFEFAALAQFTVPCATDPVKSRSPAPAAFAGVLLPALRHKKDSANRIFAVLLCVHERANRVRDRRQSHVTGRA
jgi:hypothetical protein